MQKKSVDVSNPLLQASGTMQILADVCVKKLTNLIWCQYRQNQRNERTHIARLQPQRSMSYCILLWGSASKSGKIFLLQKRALHIMWDLHHRGSCRHVFSAHRILTIQSIYVLEVYSRSYKKTPERLYILLQRD